MQRFLEYLNFPSVDAKQKFEAALLKLESLPDSFVSAFTMGSPIYFLYVQSSVEKILGYPKSKFLDDRDFAFYYSITPKKYLPLISKVMAEHGQKPFEPGFNFRNTHMTEIDAGLMNSNGLEEHIYQATITLNYSKKGDVSTVLCSNLHVTNGALESRKQQVIQILTDIKKIYVETFPEKFENIGLNQDPLVRLYHPKNDGIKEPTQKDKEVLRLLAQGHSTSTIAKMTGITTNTVETHRKHLLKKFEAKNTAELIQKASKVYWLE